MDKVKQSKQQEIEYWENKYKHHRLSIIIGILLLIMCIVVVITIGIYEQDIADKVYEFMLIAVILGIPGVVLIIYGAYNIKQDYKILSYYLK